MEISERGRDLVALGLHVKTCPQTLRDITRVNLIDDDLVYLVIGCRCAGPNGVTCNNLPAVKTGLRQRGAALWSPWAVAGLLARRMWRAPAPSCSDTLTTDHRTPPDYQLHWAAGAAGIIGGVSLGSATRVNLDQCALR